MLSKDELLKGQYISNIFLNNDNLTGIFNCRMRKIKLVLYTVLFCHFSDWIKALKRIFFQKEKNIFIFNLSFIRKLFLKTKFHIDS